MFYLILFDYLHKYIIYITYIGQRDIKMLAFPCIIFVSISNERGTKVLKDTLMAPFLPSGHIYSLPCVHSLPPAKPVLYFNLQVFL